MFTRDFTRNSPGIPPGIHPEFLSGFIMEFLQRFIHPFPTLIHPGFIQDSSLDSPGLPLEFLSEFTGDSSRHSPGIPSWIHPEFLPGFTQNSARDSSLDSPKFFFPFPRFDLGFLALLTWDSLKKPPGFHPGYLPWIHPVFLSVFIRDSSRASSEMPLGIHLEILTGFNLESSQDSPGISSKIHP